MGELFYRVQMDKMLEMMAQVVKPTAGASGNKKKPGLMSLAEDVPEAVTAKCAQFE